MITNDSGYSVPMDFISHLITMGKIFFISKAAAALATPSVTQWKVGSKPVFFKALITASTRTTITIAENPVCSADGTASPVLNRNRSFADDTMAFKRFSAPTVTSAGTIISTQILGVNGTTRNVENDAISILKPNTNYLVTITPDAASDITVDLLFWEE